MLFRISLFSLLQLILYTGTNVGAVRRICRPDCIRSNEIYCQGELLHDVQMSHIFKDNTTYVGLTMKFPEDVILKKYRELKTKLNGTVPEPRLKDFIDEYFINDINQTYPTLEDFHEYPSILNKTDIKDYRNWLAQLNKIWNASQGRMSENVKKDIDRYSLLYVPNPFVKAGGRFKEMYYWDSYWIIKGLLLCDMKTTARGMIENMLVLVHKFNGEHMPNGNRIYYETRSQPPMLIQIAADYVKATNDTSFIAKNLAGFRKEFWWWDENRSVMVEKNGKKYKMFNYNAYSCRPRPEAYRADYDLVKGMKQEDKDKVFTGLRSAAESGWDFSSRHMRGGPNKTNIGTLKDMEPQNMVYVDLNSIMHANAKILMDWVQKYEDYDKNYRLQELKNMSDNLMEAINEVLWNDKVGIWQDYDLLTHKHRNYFYVSNFTPLWSRSIRNKTYVKRAIDYLISEKIINADYTLNASLHCVPTSLTVNKEEPQQWDYPNCWAPLQAFLIYGLHWNKDKIPEAEKIALNLAQAWIDTTYTGYFERNNSMFEKYDATKLGATGDGGEYEPQTGFGWTNGLCMDIFDTWGSQIKGPHWNKGASIE